MVRRVYVRNRRTKGLLNEKMLKGLETEPVVLPAWDPMGSLA